MLLSWHEVSSVHTHEHVVEQLAAHHQGHDTTTHSLTHPTRADHSATKRHAATYRPVREVHEERSHSSY